jgi:hypothetical protein
MAVFVRFWVIRPEDFSVIFLAFFLFPLAVYCLIVGMINRRPHPVLVYGPWDFLGILLAASGAVLFGGPAILTAFYDRDVRQFLLGRLGTGQVQFGDLLAKWWLIWLLYYLGVLAGGALLVWLRREMTAVYNVEPAVFDDTLAQVLDRLGVESTRMGNRVFIGLRGSGGRVSAGPAEQLPPEVSEHIIPGPLPREAPRALTALVRLDQEAVVDVEPFAATRHVTLNWRNSTGRVREEVEAELARALREVQTRDNPAGGWFMVIATSLFALVLVSVVMVILLEIRMNKVQFP